MTDIYVGGSFGMESDVELTDQQIEELHHELIGLVIELTLPTKIAEQLDVNIKHFDWIDEVEII